MVVCNRCVCLQPMPTAKKLLIIYHTYTGGSQQMAHAVSAAASAAQCVQVQLQTAQSTHVEHLLDADGYVFVCPEQLAAISGLMKDCFDRCYYPALERLQGRPYATLICAGSDGSQAARQIARIATGWRLQPVAPPLIVCTHAQTPQAIAADKQIAADDLQRCAELGAAFAQGMALGIF